MKCKRIPVKVITTFIKLNATIQRVNIKQSINCTSNMKQYQTGRRGKRGEKMEKRN